MGNVNNQGLQQEYAGGRFKRVVSQTDGGLGAYALVRFDSSALAVLLECRRASQALGKGFVVRSLDTRLAGLSVLYGVDGLLPDAPLPLGSSIPA